MPIRFADIDAAPLIRFKSPEKATKYTIGIDTATGLGKDYTVMNVLSNRMPFEQVAKYRAKISVVDASGIANILGLYYNKAHIVCEVNYPGNAVQDSLIMTYRYPNNYQAEQHLDESPNVSSKFGFTTTQSSKWLLIREFLAALQNDEIIINDLHTLDELGTFVYIEDKTKTGAAEGMNDDEVMSIMLAYHGAMTRPQKALPKIDKPSEGNAQARAMLDRFMRSIQNPVQEVHVV